MNAPLLVPLTGGSVDLPGDLGMGALEGLARHVSNEGCQFVVSGAETTAGQRLRFATADGTVVSGAIQWVLGDRIAFAFDRPIDAATMLELARPRAAAGAIALLLCPAEQPEG